MQKRNGQHYFEQGYALIIGISRYSKAPRLSEAILKDVLKLHDVLRDLNHCGYHDSQVRLLLDDDASAQGIREGLHWLAQHASQNATVFIYFSGHGWKLEKPAQQQYYLLSCDSDPAMLESTAISGDELTALLDPIQAQRLFLCLDSCYAGGIGEIKGDKTITKAGLLEESDYARLAQGTGRVIVASSRFDESSLAFRSMNNSLFTYYLLDALQGKAHIRGDGLIHILDIFHYISEHMLVYHQHAILKTSRFETNFPIALYPKESSASKSNATHRMQSVQAIQTNKGEIDTRALREAMANFNRDDLDLLCADIQQDLADDGITLVVSLAHAGKDGPIPNQVLNLINYLQRRGHLSYLVNAVQRARPGLF